MHWDSQICVPAGNKGVTTKGGGLTAKLGGGFLGLPAWHGDDEGEGWEGGRATKGARSKAGSGSKDCQRQEACIASTGVSIAPTEAPCPNEGPGKGPGLRPRSGEIAVRRIRRVPAGTSVEEALRQFGAGAGGGGGLGEPTPPPGSYLSALTAEGGSQSKLRLQVASGACAAGTPAEDGLFADEGGLLSRGAGLLAHEGGQLARGGGLLAQGGRLSALPGWSTAPLMPLTLGLAAGGLLGLLVAVVGVTRWGGYCRWGASCRRERGRRGPRVELVWSDSTRRQPLRRSLRRAQLETAA